MGLCKAMTRKELLLGVFLNTDPKQIPSLGTVFKRLWKKNRKVWVKAFRYWSFVSVTAEVGQENCICCFNSIHNYDWEAWNTWEAKRSCRCTAALRMSGCVGKQLPLVQEIMENPSFRSGLGNCTLCNFRK